MLIRRSVIFNLKPNLTTLHTKLKTKKAMIILNKMRYACNSFVQLY